MPKSTENVTKDELKNVKEDKETIEEQSVNSEKNENPEIQKATNMVTTGSTKALEKTEIDADKQINLSIFNFCDYLIYKITCGKRKNDIDIYKDLMKQIISIENLMLNYLNINGLLKLEYRRRSQRLSAINKIE